MRVLREYPRRTDADQVHSVREDNFGNIFCTCPAGDFGYDCWAVKKVKGEIQYQLMMDKKWELAGIKIPEKSIVINEQWNYVSSEMKRLKIGVKHD